MVRTSADHQNLRAYVTTATSDQLPQPTATYSTRRRPLGSPFSWVSLFSQLGREPTEVNQLVGLPEEVLVTTVR